MKKTSTCLWVAALCCLSVLTPDPARAISVHHAQGVLGTTDALVLVIDGVDEQLAAHGLSRARLEQTLASGLRAAGMQVVSEQDLAAANNAGVLRLSVRLNRAPYYFYLYNVKLTLDSKLPMNPDGTAFVTTATWTDGWVGSLQPTDVGQIQNFTEELLARFLAQRAGERRAEIPAG